MRHHGTHRKCSLLLLPLLESGRKVVMSKDGRYSTIRIHWKQLTSKPCTNKAFQSTMRLGAQYMDICMWIFAFVCQKTTPQFYCIPCKSPDNWCRLQKERWVQFCRELDSDLDSRLLSVFWLLRCCLAICRCLPVYRPLEHILRTLYSKSFKII